MEIENEKLNKGDFQRIFPEGVMSFNMTMCSVDDREMSLRVSTRTIAEYVHSKRGVNKKESSILFLGKYPVDEVIASLAKEIAKIDPTYVLDNSKATVVNFFIDSKYILSVKQITSPFTFDYLEEEIKVTTPETEAVVFPDCDQLTTGCEYRELLRRIRNLANESNFSVLTTRLNNDDERDFLLAQEVDMDFYLNLEKGSNRYEAKVFKHRSPTPHPEGNRMFYSSHLDTNETYQPFNIYITNEPMGEYNGITSLNTAPLGTVQVTEDFLEALKTSKEPIEVNYIRLENDKSTPIRTAMLPISLFDNIDEDELGYVLRSIATLDGLVYEGLNI